MTSVAAARAILREAGLECYATNLGGNIFGIQVPSRRGWILVTESEVQGMRWAVGFDHDDQTPGNASTPAGLVGLVRHYQAVARTTELV